MATDFGSCWSCTTDLTMPSIMATGFRVVGEAIARRWQTPRGALVDDPNYGFDLSDYVNDDLGRGDLTRIGQSASAEALKDERVISCDVSISLDTAGLMMVTARVGTAQGPFQLVLSVDHVTATLLQVRSL